MQPPDDELPWEDLELLVNRGAFQVALRRLDQIATESAPAELFVTLQAARVHAFLEEFDVAISELERAKNVALHTPPVAPQVTALIWNVQCMLALFQKRYEQAYEYCRQALSECPPGTQDWQRSAVLLNKGSVAIALRRPEEGLRLLAEAEQVARRSEASDDLIAARLATLETNRASALFALGRLGDGTDTLLHAKDRARNVGNSFLEAKQNYNLSIIYDRLKMHQSSLDAAAASCDGYVANGAHRASMLAGAAVAQSLNNLGRSDKAVELAVSLVGERPWDEIGPDDDEWLINLQYIYIDALRNLGKLAESERLRQARAAAFGIPISFNEYIDFMINTLADAFIAVLDGEPFAVPAPIADRRYAIDIGEIDDRQAYVEMFDALRALLIDRVWNPNPVERAARLLHSPLAVRQILGIGETFMAHVRSDAEEVLRVTMCTLYEHQLYVGQLETTEGRSYAHLVGVDNSLDIAAEPITSLNAWSVQFEILEFIRRESATRVDYPAGGLIAPYTMLGLGGSEFDRDVHVLQPSKPYRVLGKSAIADASRIEPSSVDADTVRERLGSSHAAWLTQCESGGWLYWALLTKDGVTGGREPLNEDWLEARRWHHEMLAVPLQRDRRSIEESAPPWCVDLVALARASIGPLLHDHDRFKDCIDALPRRYQTAARYYASSFAELDDAVPYARFAKYALPGKLLDLLASAGTPLRLLLSPATSIATVPFGLLPVGDGRLLEHATIQFVPPSHLSTTIAQRRPVTGLHELALAVSNPTGDLAAPDSAGADVYRAVSREDLLALLNDLAEDSTERGILSYIGHIRPGSIVDPTSAALVLAGPSPAQSRSYLTARDILKGSMSIPPRVYLGACEGAGFDTGAEWGSVASALIAKGASTVIAHCWPVLDAPAANMVDRVCIDALREEGSEALQSLWRQQLVWLSEWRDGAPNAIAPYYWSGLQYIGNAQ